MSAIDALLEAAKRGGPSAVQALLSKGVDVNWTDVTGMTTLMRASQEGELDVVQALLANGADVNVQRRPDGATALTLASVFGKQDVVEVLLAHCSKANPKGGASALKGASNAQLDAMDGVLEVINDAHRRRVAEDALRKFDQKTKAMIDEHMLKRASRGRTLRGSRPIKKWWQFWA